MSDRRATKLLSWDDEAPIEDGMNYEQWERLRSERSEILIAKLKEIGKYPA